MKKPLSFPILAILADLIRGGRHSRTTVARIGISLKTADRWLKELGETIPGVRGVKEGRITWWEWRAPATAATKRARGPRAESVDPRQVELLWEDHVP